MKINDYLNLVSEYIFYKLEGKKYSLSNFYIYFDEDSLTNTNYCVIKEKLNDIDLLYFKFPCLTKEEYYIALKNTMIERFKDNDLIMYTAINYGNYFSIISKKGIQFFFEIKDKEDIVFLNEFKKYLDNNDLDENISLKKRL